MAGTNLYITGPRALLILRALRAEAEQIFAESRQSMLEEAENFERFIRARFPRMAIPPCPPLRKLPRCIEHGEYMEYNKHTGEFDCPVVGCDHHYRWEEPHGEAAEAYYEGIAEVSQSAKHGGSSKVKRRRTPPKRIEGSLNARRINLGEARKK